MKTPNWLYCFANEKQDVNESNSIGLLNYSLGRIDQGTNLFVDLEPEDVDEFTFQESLHYALDKLGMLGKYCDSYFNVSEKDITYAALKFDYIVMILIDSKKKEQKIKEIAKELFQHWYDMKYPVNENEFQKSKKRYQKRLVQLEAKLLKFNVLK